MPKVWLDEMTWREAKERLSQCDAAFIPTGPIEGHGPHVPLGCDYYVASAVAKLLAEKSGGVALPPLPYNFSGGTSAFPGTVSIPIRTQVQVLMDIARALWRQGVKRIFIVSIHGPNSMIVGTAVRTLFEEENIPAMFLNAWAHAGEKARQRLPHAEGDAIPDVAALNDVPAGKLPEPLRKLQRFGSVGFHYSDEMQHIPPRAGIDPDVGVELLDETAEALLPAVEHLGEYLEHLESHPRSFIE
jgi:hypothetical protein